MPRAHGEALGLSLCQYHGWQLTGLQTPLDSRGIQKLEPTGSEKDLSVGTTEITALGMQLSQRHGALKSPRPL